MRRKVLFLLCAVGIAAGAEVLPDPLTGMKRASAKGEQTAVFAGGCFWCTEAVFEQLAGVTNVVSGYAGGTRETAKYNLVAAGETDHAESIQITFDPSRISYGELLKVFFATSHDPTQLNKQGPDHGAQYRSAIFYANDEQRRIAKAYIEQLGQAKAFRAQIVTQVRELTQFFPAEQSHQDFVKRNPGHPYVVVNAVPKVKKTRETFAALLKK